jgi:hypothetical protein
MRKLIPLALALAGAATALAEDRAPAEASQQQGAERSDSKAGDPAHEKGYGYGTPSGVESNASAGQPTKAAPGSAPQEEAHADSPRGGERGAGKMLHGKIAEVSRRALSLRGEAGKVERLQLSARTTVVRDGKAVPVKELRAGEEVRASYEEGKGGLVATQITIVSQEKR